MLGCKKHYNTSKVWWPFQLGPSILDRRVVIDVGLIAQGWIGWFKSSYKRCNNLKAQALTNGKQRGNASNNTTLTMIFLLNDQKGNLFRRKLVVEGKVDGKRAKGRQTITFKEGLTFSDAGN